MTTVLLIIDAQHDFCHPEGALFVPGAEEDMFRLARWIEQNIPKLDHVILTMDSHPVLDISHPGFWIDDNGKHPAPFTQITFGEIEAGKWKAIHHQEEAHVYVKKLEAQGEFPHFIWPEHCISGSIGYSIDKSVMLAVREWCKKGTQHQLVEKGTYPLSEHFGAFSAQISNSDYPETLFNQSLVNQLDGYDQIVIAGEARSHCVATSLKQIMDFAPGLCEKIVLLEDCMSDVAGMGDLAKPIYQKAADWGIRRQKSTEWSLS